ncbi:MAG: PGF-pre-PGF domain-containing protein [Methanosarcinaceae archaeon]|nr:PGF-pre-PGF domain-containing protein [Methanosarcinaceae archaeon]
MPAPTLRLSPAEGLAPLSAGVEVEGPGEPDSWNLSLGDGRWINGTGSDAINGTVNYTKVGEYTLRLIVSRGEFSNSTTGTVKALAQSSDGVRKLPAGTHNSFRVPDSTIYEVGVIAGETIPYVFFTVEKKSLPSGITPPPEAFAVYEYNEVTHSRVSDSSFNGATLSFSVPKTWFEEHGLIIENVVLYRYHNGSWQALDTEVLDEDATDVRFSAKTPGFSLFAIGVRASTPEMEVEVRAAPELPEPAGTPVEPESTQEKIPVWYGQAVLAIGAAYLLKKRRL